MEEKQPIVTQKNAIIFILLGGFFLRLLTAVTLGEKAYLYSDDVNYIYSAVDLLKSGQLTYGTQAYRTVFGMPGMFYFLALAFKVFGYGESGLFLTRILFSLLGAVAVYGVYLCAACISRSLRIANIAAVSAAICLPWISVGVFFLTETPYICLLVLLSYWMFKFCKEPSDKNFIALLVVYLLNILFKPVVGIYPLAFLPYILYCRMPVQQIFKRGICAAFIVIVFLTPWTIRNYYIAGDLIPLSGNQGDTLLLGSFDGENVPAGTYAESVAQIKENTDIQHPYDEFKARGELGAARLAQWKRENPESYYRSTYFEKPYKLLRSLYYPIEVFDISVSILYVFFRIQSMLALLGLLWTVRFGRRKPEMFFTSLSLLAGNLMILYINAHYAALPRYGITNYFPVHIFSAMGICAIADGLRKMYCQIRGAK